MFIVQLSHVKIRMAQVKRPLPGTSCASTTSAMKNSVSAPMKVNPKNHGIYLSRMVINLTPKKRDLI
jgi:hypothetical protein